MAHSPKSKNKRGGFDIIECASLDEAVEMAARQPAAASGAIEASITYRRSSPTWEVGVHYYLQPVRPESSRPGLAAVLRTPDGR
jgi:hypothetical protein